MHPYRILPRRRMTTDLGNPTKGFTPVNRTQSQPVFRVG
ncbi:hypothetical protein LINPERHAP1_LOCUS388 [Linum perenne]